MLSVVEKASILNRLRKLKYPATPCEKQTNIVNLFKGYSKETNIIIDSMIWRVYGLHYSDFIDTDLASCGICTYDPIKMEKAIDKKILYFEQELKFTPLPE